MLQYQVSYLTVVLQVITCIIQYMPTEYKNKIIQAHYIPTECKIK